mmetsp:Transcript_7357/g.13632  ORF Transcript_7357/g.13632 Transcript_7357/m.13632 type:complete len:301 (-) Transcript_7357:5235-6137(-)
MTHPREGSLTLTCLSTIFAGAYARLLVHPLDTIKAKLQVQQCIATPEFTSIRNAAATTLKNEGPRGLYRGLFTALLGSVPACMIYYTTYEFVKRMSLKSDWLQRAPFTAYMLGGMTAEAVSCLIFVPVDVIKERLQVQSNLKMYKYSGGVDAFKQIIATEGIRGIYKAYGATVGSFGPFSALYFSFYETFTKFLVVPGSDISLGQSLLCAASAGSLASWITNPLDMAKLRMQVARASSENEIFKYKNMMHGVYTIYKTEGFKALFQGSVARIAFHTPNTAIAMSLLEYFRVLLRPYVDGA